MQLKVNTRLDYSRVKVAAAATMRLVKAY